MNIPKEPRSESFRDPIALLETALKKEWVKAGTPSVPELALATKLEPGDVHLVLRSKKVAPWPWTEKVLRALDVDDLNAMAAFGSLHQEALALEKRYASLVISPSDPEASSPRLRPVESEKILAALADHFEHKLASIDLSWINEDSEFLEEVRKLQKAGNLSQRQIADKFVAANHKICLGRTSIAKYVGAKATNLPRSHSAEQVKVLIMVLLEAANPGKQMPEGDLEQFMMAWRSLMAKEARVKKRVDEASFVEVIEQAPKELALASGPSAELNHELRLAQIEEGPQHATFAIRVMALFVILSVIGLVIYQFATR